MEIRQLKYFLAVADQRSFINAANTLFITRQAISKAISQLEQELQVELFMRDSNGAFLTPAGVLFYDRVRGTVAEFEAIRQEMLAYGSRYRKRLRLGFAIGTLPLFEQRLRDFCAQQKNADIDYGEYPQSQCRSLLLERKLDAAVMTQSLDEAQFSCAALLGCRLGVLLRADSALADRPRLRMAELSGTPLAAHTELLLPASLEAEKPVFTGFDYGRLLSLAAQGRCALLLPELLAGDAPDALTFRPVEDAPEWTAYAVRQRTSNAGALSNTLLDELLQQALQQPQGREGAAHERA